MRTKDNDIEKALANQEMNSFLRDALKSLIIHMALAVPIIVAMMLLVWSALWLAGMR